MRRRPLVVAALAYIAGISLGRHVPGLPISLLFALTALSLALASISHRSKPGVSQVALIGAIIATGALLYYNSRLPAEALYLQSREWAYIQGVVADYPAQGPERTSFILRPRDSAGYLQVFYFHKGAGEPLQISYGDELRLYAEVEWPEKIDSFDYREYLLQRGIWGTVGVWSKRDLKLVAHGRGNPILALGYSVRERLFRFIDHHIPCQAGLLKALLFGERGYLEAGLEEQFRDAGVAHVLAVSGLHLGIILGLFWLVLRRIRLSAGMSYALLIPVVAFYLLLVGFRVSLVRAAVMFAFLALGLVLAERGLILRKWADPYQSLSAAALAILGWQPQALFDVSFQLSFSATLGIIFFLPKLERTELLKLIRPRWLRGLIAVSLAAQLGVIPFIAWHFQRFYLLVILANLAVIPLVTAALWGGVGLLFLGLAIPPLASYLGLAEDRLLEALEWLTAALARLRFSYLELAGAAFFVCLGLYLAFLAAAVALVYFRSRPARPPSPERS
ncbi:MAG: ComEC family competence protein [Candidatus Acetothermia bacterium]|jgi:competence protein ComEC|nr:ComEC family competence protein [Candidatus Acetothermia bacterium]MDH7505580.1 ComEC/Rec2 family competence protein [Candidatus Acetothermia bacterium]